MAGQHHQCNEHELRQTPGDGEGQGGLEYSSPWGHKESDTTGRLNNSNLVMQFFFLLSVVLLFFHLVLGGTARGILVPQPGMDPMPPCNGGAES